MDDIIHLWLLPGLAACHCKLPKHSASAWSLQLVTCQACRDSEEFRKEAVLQALSGPQEFTFVSAEFMTDGVKFVGPSVAARKPR